MIFEQNPVFSKIGVIGGYTIAYFVFTIILYLVLSLSNSLPSGWNYLSIIPVTICISIVGESLKRVLR